MAGTQHLPLDIKPIYKVVGGVIELDTDDEAEEIQEVKEVQQHKRSGRFRLMDLPAELRNYIYELLLPRNLNITFTSGICTATSRTAYWLTWMSTKESPARMVQVGRDPDERRSRSRGAAFRRLVPNMETQLFLVNKTVSSEARAILYGSNTYQFCVDSAAHFPKSLQSPLIFGAFGEDVNITLPLLRNLRSIQLAVLLNGSSHWNSKRHYGRLEYFVKVLKEHADDDSRKSLLQQLQVEMTLSLHNNDATSPPPPPAHWATGLMQEPDEPWLVNSEKFMFSLESLAALRGIKEVKIIGVPAWFAQCLELCIQGKGGEVKKTQWPLIEVKRKVPGTKKKFNMVWVTTRRWYQPTLNWQEFAKRNGIELPADVDKYWMEEI